MYENDIVRYCDTDAANMLNCLSPSTSVKVTCVPPNRSPPLVTPTFDRRPSLEEQLLERALLAHVLLDERVASAAAGSR